MERVGPAGGSAYSPPLLVQLGTMQRDAWLRDLLDVCKHALDEWRERESLEVQSLIADLERVRAKVQRALAGPARASA